MFENRKNANQTGFTLVELSIVLVIIGLLIGGILGGQELIRASELNSIATDIEKYKVAVNAFKLKYNALPGDIRNATAYWGTSSGGCPSGTGTGTQTCNGDGNGRVDFGATATWFEPLRFWQHLSNSGIIPGNYTGTAGALAYTLCGYGDHRLGTNSPLSKVSNTGYAAVYLGAYSGLAYMFDGDYGNSFIYAAQTDGCEPVTSALSPIDASSIDTKIDDGKPGMGLWLTRTGGTCNNGTNSTGFTATYTLTTSSASCFFYVRKAF